MMQAVQRLARYKQLIAPMALETTVDQTGSLTVSPGWLFATDIPISLQVAELAFYRLLRLATREPVKALSVAIPQRPEAVSARHYERFFGIAMQYGEKPYIVFPPRISCDPF
jgi:hypothetical protein